MFDEAIARLWHEGLISGEMRRGTGEEAVVVGVVAQVREGDAMVLDHRGTAALLVRGVDPVLILGELLVTQKGWASTTTSTCSSTASTLELGRTHTVAFGIFRDFTGARYHHISYPMKLGVGTPGAQLTAVGFLGDRPDWDPIPWTTFPVYYPAQVTMDWLLSEDHVGRWEMQQDVASCAACHGATLEDVRRLSQGSIDETGEQTRSAPRKKRRRPGDPGGARMRLGAPQPGLRQVSSRTAVTKNGVGPALNSGVRPASSESSPALRRVGAAVLEPAGRHDLRDALDPPFDGTSAATAAPPQPRAPGVRASRAPPPRTGRG